LDGGGWSLRRRAFDRVSLRTHPAAIISIAMCGGKS
jgi:hypothetical protein